MRGLHLRPTYVPALVSTPGTPPDFGSLILPLQGSASADDDTLVGIFQRNALPFPLQDLLNGARCPGCADGRQRGTAGDCRWGLGRMVQGPTVTTWPRLQPASFVAGDGGPDTWDTIDPNQRFIPQSPPDPVDPEAFDECLEDCGEDCEDCDCGCHPLDIAKAGIQRVQKVINDADVQKAFVGIQNLFDTTNAQMPVPARLWDVVKTDQFTDLLDALVVADGRASKTATARAQVAVKAKVVAGAVAEPVIHAEAVPAAVDARAARESADAAQAILIEAQAAADRAAERQPRPPSTPKPPRPLLRRPRQEPSLKTFSTQLTWPTRRYTPGQQQTPKPFQAAADNAQAAVIADALQGGTEVAQTGATPKGAETFETADYGAQVRSRKSSHSDFRLRQSPHSLLKPSRLKLKPWRPKQRPSRRQLRPSRDGQRGRNRVRHKDSQRAGASDMLTERQYQDLLDRMQALRSQVSERLSGSLVSNPALAEEIDRQLEDLVQAARDADAAGPMPPDRGLAELVGVGPEAA